MAKVGEEISTILDKAADYALGHTMPTMPKRHSYDNKEFGSDRAASDSEGKEYSLSAEGLDIKVSDTNRRNSSGTYSISWSDVNYRELEITRKGKLLVRASRCLGGEAGHSGLISGSSQRKVEPTPWKIEKADSLEDVVKEIEKITGNYRQ